MPVTDNQLDLIFRYFDGDLSAEEEEQLMQQLQQHVELQQAFDQQILMQQFQQSELVEPVISTVTESADDFLKRVTNSMEVKQTPAVVRPIRMVKKNYVWIAAAAVVLVCMLTVTIYYFNRKNTGNPVVKLPVIDSVAQIKKSAPKQLQNDTMLTQAESLQQLYADNYLPFSNNTLDVPPAATIYETDYKQRNYKTLANLSESVLETKGSGDPAEEEEITNYFHFYKALSALQLNDTAKAETLLKKLLQNRTGKTKLANHVRWYLLMVYLKTNNKVNALQTAKLLITDKENPYYTKALEISEKLGH